MKLKSFRVRDFRSVNDSGLIEVRERMALVGRNESGKTNLRLTLASLNPPGGMDEMTFVKDFPATE
jgi:predicted ATP-dependent endonuclease of OLD family